MSRYCVSQNGLTLLCRFTPELPKTTSASRPCPPIRPRVRSRRRSISAVLKRLLIGRPPARPSGSREERELRPRRQLERERRAPDPVLDRLERVRRAGARRAARRLPPLLEAPQLAPLAEAP